MLAHKRTHTNSGKIAYFLRRDENLRKQIVFDSKDAKKISKSVDFFNSLSDSVQFDKTNLKGSLDNA